MNPGKPSTFLCSPDAVDWVKDLDQVLIIDRRRRVSYLLRDEEAVVWGWLASAYSYSKIVRMLESLIAVSSSQAEDHLRGFIQKWCLADLLKLESGEHG